MPAKRPLIVADADIPYLRGRLEPYADVRYLRGAEIKTPDVREADALIIRTRTRCDRDLLYGSSLKCIATATIGTDHISVRDCSDLGIEVFNAPGCNAPGVAQWVWSAILSQDRDPAKTTVGIIGLGNVGRIVAQWGRALGFRILVNDPPRSQKGDSPLPFAREWSDLKSLLAESDVITIHTPFTTDGPFPTYHLLNGKNIPAIPSGTLILNAARGGIIDEKELIPHLTRGRLSAIIDTWENEPDISRELLAETILATPHIAGYSLEGKQRATRMAVEATAKCLGIGMPDLTDLAAPFNGHTPSACEITKSYSPVEDAIALYTHPEDFERLRAEYNYRSEP